MESVFFLDCGDASPLSQSGIMMPHAKALRALK
jgi:hypothetical protein